MSVLLVGDFDLAGYEEWHGRLKAELNASETLVLPGDNHDTSEVEIALVANPPAGVLAAYPRLTFIQSLWAGVDRLLGDPLLPRGVPIARLVDPGMTRSMTEAVLTAVLGMHRQMPAYARQQSMRVWRPLAQPLAPARKVAVLGLGELGGAAARALAALGFVVEGWSRRARAVEGVQCRTGADGFAAALQGAHFVVNLLPLTAETTGILDAAAFSRLSRGAGVVNLARGAHLREDDLLEALGSGAVGHAVLDVFAAEPLPPGHPFWSHPGITVLPHVAAHTDPATAARIAAENVAAFRAGRTPSALVELRRGY